MLVGEELRRLVTWGERHRRLLARLVITFCLSLLVDVVCATLMWSYEHGLKGSSIHGFGDALFFTTVQLLTISSQMANPLTAAGRVVDVGLEVWAIVVVASIGGSFAAFFTSGDRS